MQNEPIAGPSAAPEGAIISPDTLRTVRIPPGQSRTRKWPVLDAGGPPAIDLQAWTLSVGGLVGTPANWDWPTFLSLPRVKVFSDFHCVTRWSRLGNVWEGVSTRELVKRAGELKENVRFVLARGHDAGWTANLPIDDFMAEDALVAIAHDGEPLSLEHGGPARLVAPRLYAWKSVKWLSGIQFMEQDQAGFWERNGYHMHGDRWKEERYGW